MVSQEARESLPLIEYVRALEGKDSRARGEQVESALALLGIKPVVQACRLLRIRNLIVDFAPSASEKLVFSAHYDAVKNSPAANDNASSVAVLLGLCRELKGRHLPVRVIFFDREEAWIRTPFLRLGLLGSLYYVFSNSLRDISAVYNLEFCGMGDSLAIWPVKQREKNLPVVKTAETVAAKLKLSSGLAHVPWVFLSSDHLSFRLKGLSNAITLTLLPATQIELFERLITKVSIPKLLIGRKPSLPEPLAFVHTAADTSSRLSEDSLRLMQSILLEIIRQHLPPG